MVEDSAALGRQHDNKFLSKHRWRAKIFSNDEMLAKDTKQKLKLGEKSKLDDDVNDFLRPSTDKAHAQKEAAAAAFLAGTNKPRIDVAKAQRWPGASDLAGKSPGVGGLRTSKQPRRQGLMVSFARTQPEFIGEGGDECEEAVIEVAKRRKTNSMSSLEKLQAQTHHDDSNLGMRSPKLNGNSSGSSEAARRNIVKRSLTSHGELSPPLKHKLDMGNITTHASPAPPPPQRLGAMGLGERPKQLQRAPTGFDAVDDGVSRPSLDSTYSYDSEMASPVISMKAPNLAPTAEEEEEFVPKPLKRMQTGWQDQQADSIAGSVPRLPEMNLKDDDSPLESSLNKHFLESEPTDPNSFSARVMHKMRAEEGRALHEAMKQATEGSKRDSDSSSNSVQPNSFQVGTPPSSYNVASASSYGQTPPRIPSRDPPNGPQTLDAEDPHRSHARRPSPARRPMPPGAFPLDTDPRPPSSSSSQYNSAVSRSRGSPTRPTDPYSATSIQQTPSTMEKIPFSASSNSQSSILPTPPQFEKGPYFSPEPPAEKPPPPPPHAQDPGMQVATPYKQDAGIQVAPHHRQDAGMQVAPHHRQDPGMQVVASLERSDTRSQGEVAFGDFAERVTHMQGIFGLTAQLGGQLYDHTPMQWIRVAIWWFLRGRAGMESLIRSRPKTGDTQPERLTQPHVDLAKVWWILTQIISNHPALRRYSGRMDAGARLAREAGDVATAEVYEAHDAVLSSLKMLLASMKRHQVMPPTQALIQGQDQSIWIQYPNFAPDVRAVLDGSASNSIKANGSGSASVNPTFYIPLGDTKSDFCYFRMFVNAKLHTDNKAEPESMSAVISVLRSRDDFKVKLAICSLTDLINVLIQSNKDLGPTWSNIAWNSKKRAMSISLRHGFTLDLEFTEADFRSLWAIVDHTNRVESRLREREDERLVYKLTARGIQYKDPTNPGAFPPEHVKACKVLVFEKFERSDQGTGRRRLHRGYRLVLVTNVKNRTLSCVNHELGTNQEPINFEYYTEKTDNAPGMILRLKEETSDKKTKVCTMMMVFNDSKERNHLFGTLTSMNQHSNEDVCAQVPLKAFNIESADPAEGFSNSGKDVLKRLQWQEVKALNKNAEKAGLESAPIVMSESLRLVCKHGAGSVTDRMNLGPGELLVRLPINGAAELVFLRNPQQDIAVAIDARRTEKDIPDALTELLRTLTGASTLRTLTFHSFKDLHAFQLAVTGFSVKFDGIASTFSISRRRMVVPIYKQWTASNIRIQIVTQDNIIQLLAFFEDFSHADAMNFQLKTMDVFEKTDKGGKPGIRLVDAKFALPVEERRGEGKMGKEEGRVSGWAGMKRKFVCLDVIEYPGEHDDILIQFESADTRDKFADALPSATVERKFTIKRKI
ncbi:uncharacterized protein BDR25DRAFT_50611 [Lindgomyces ingoldianus]|uniref:Uncharacterized protein n=1 Tax=Lindgomyces ingoldianus TaxID=673940 RepID=A0ACB6QSH0_9PLEO|nr:uncharacterized protein BDR25DRAFT_50611 [Lindgomyces ingoldianus]KAF2469027.1 hypothetical protein BDR25DRAFT_50611 [Lindgomyces ingoldianus]